MKLSMLPIGNGPQLYKFNSLLQKVFISKVSSKSHIKHDFLSICSLSKHLSQTS
jgi:hypothetical protein